MHFFWAILLLHASASDSSGNCEGTNSLSPTACHFTGKTITFGGSNFYAISTMWKHDYEIRPAVIPCKYGRGTRIVKFSGSGQEGHFSDRVFKVFLGMGQQCSDKWTEDLTEDKQKQLIQICDVTLSNKYCSREGIPFSDLSYDNQCICVILYCTSEASIHHTCMATINAEFSDPAATALMPFVIFGFVWYDLIFFIYSTVMVCSIVCVTIGCVMRWHPYWHITELPEWDDEEYSDGGYGDY